MSHRNATALPQAHKAAAIPPLPEPSKERRWGGSACLPFGDYAHINPAQWLADDAEQVRDYEANHGGFPPDGWWWDHQGIRFLNQKMGLMALLMVVPFLWAIVVLVSLMWLGAWILKPVQDWPAIVGIPLLLLGVGGTVALIFFVCITTTQPLMNGLTRLLKPFEKSLGRRLDNALEDGLSEFNRQTGMVRLAKGKGKHFEAPFVEFDAYIDRVVQRGGIFYQLVLRHRYTGKLFTQLSFNRPAANISEIHAVWDMLQRFMDVDQPLPDVPFLEPFRDKDPTTAEHDRQTGRNPRYWRDLDLERWKKEELRALAEQERNYPWDNKRCQLTPQLGKVDWATYEQQQQSLAAG